MIIDAHTKIIGICLDFSHKFSIAKTVNKITTKAAIIIRYVGATKLPSESVAEANTDSIYAAIPINATVLFFIFY